MKALMQNAKRNEDKVVKLQSWARGTKVRKDVQKQLAQMEKEQYYANQGQYGQPTGYYVDPNMQYQ